MERALIRTLSVAVAIGTALAPAAATAQARFPEKIVRMVVPAPPGRGPDAIEIGRAHV